MSSVKETADKSAGGTTPQREVSSEQSQTGAATPQFAAAGEVFTNWFNRRIGDLTHPTIKLGTKTAEVIRLHEDGRLECVVEGEGSKNEQIFVAFEPAHLDQLLRRITALGF